MPFNHRTPFQQVVAYTRLDFVRGGLLANFFFSATLYSRRTCSQDCGGTRLCTPTNNSLIMFDANRLFHTSYIGIRSIFLTLFLKSFFFALFCSVLFYSILLPIHHAFTHAPKAGPSRFHTLDPPPHLAVQGLRRLALPPLELLKRPRLQLQRRRLFHLGFELHKPIPNPLVRDRR